MPLLCRIIQAHPEAEVTAITNVSAVEGQHLLSLAPGARLLDWEDLLADASSDVVIVAPCGDWTEKGEQLRRLSLSEKSILATVPICETLLAAELELNFEDIPHSIAPICPDGCWSHWHDLATWLDDQEKSPVGEIQQIVLQREITEDFSKQPLPHVASDIVLLQKLVGPFSRVSALTTQKDSDDWRGTTVSLLGDSKVVAQWTSSSGRGDSILVLGRDGQAVFRFDPGKDTGSLEIGNRTERTTDNEIEPYLTSLVDQCLQQTKADSSSLPTWRDVCRGLEVAEVVERSRRKGRTIELHEEERSEESSFKGVMATGSCLILMLAMGLLFVFSLVEGVRLPFARNEYERHRREARDAGRPIPKVHRTHILVRLWPFYPFAIFLLLQLFRLIVPARPKTETNEPEPSP